MHRDITFEGIVLILVSLTFLFMTFVEMPFYPQEINVQRVAIVAVVSSAIVLLFGLASGGNRHPSTPGLPA